MSKIRMYSIIPALRRKETERALDYAVGEGFVRYTVPLGATSSGPVTHWGASYREHEEAMSGVLAAVFDTHDEEQTGTSGGLAFTRFRLLGAFLAGWIEVGPGAAQVALDSLSLVPVRSSDPQGADAAGTAIADAITAEEAVTLSGAHLLALRDRIDAELAARVSNLSSWESAYGIGQGMAKAIAGL